MNILREYESEEGSDDSDFHGSLFEKTNENDLISDNNINTNYFNLGGDDEEEDNDNIEPPSKIMKVESFQPKQKMNILQDVQKIDIPATKFWTQENLEITYKNQINNISLKCNSQSKPSTENIGLEYRHFKHKNQTGHFRNTSSCSKNSTHTITSPIHRKYYYIHSKVTPYLHKKVKNLPASKLEKEIFAHEGVINKIKWNNSSYSHLFVSASMDTKLKIWNIWSQLDPCLKVLNLHSKAVKDVEWSPCGKKILSCGYDRKAIETDVESGKAASTFHHTTYVSCGKFHPVSPSIVVTGGNNCVQAWDCRTPQSPCREYVYKDKYGQVQDVLFSHDGKQLYTCNDLVSKDSADRNIMIWDYSTGVVLSNQVYQERYTCTKLKLHQSEANLLAQTQGGYIALFSTNKPYKMNKAKRFEGHKLLGYKIGFDVTPDGSTVYSGSSDGKIYCYNYNTGKQFKTLTTGLDICMDVDCHPVLPSTLLCCGWNGVIQVWH